MTEREIHIHTATNIVQEDDIEEFGIKLMQAVSACYADGPPTIAFSHTANGDGGYNYAAIVHGATDPNRESKTTDLRDKEQT